MSTIQDTARSGIYQIRHTVSGKVYIGSASAFLSRWARHRKDLKKGHHHSRRLQNSWNKHGADAFRFEILEFVDNKADLIVREQDWINRLQSHRPSVGFNISPTAGSPLGVKRSAEVRAKMSASRKGSPGPIVTPEARARGNAKRRGVPLAPERRDKLRAAILGKKASEETRAKLSAMRKGRKMGPMSEERKAKISAAHKGKPGRPHTPETRAKMSEAHLRLNKKGKPGRPQTAESRAKNAESNRRRWQEGTRKDASRKRQKEPANTQGTFGFMAE